jgi:hypothetical protein
MTTQPSKVMVTTVNLSQRGRRLRGSNNDIISSKQLLTAMPHYGGRFRDNDFRPKCKSDERPRQNGS